MIWYYGQDPVQKNQECAVPLGIQGENQSLVYTADVSDWLALWPSGVVALVLQAPDKSEPYMGNTSLDRENGVVTWTITSFDTSIVGYGFGELRIVENDVVKKSYRFATYIRPSILASAAEPPAPTPEWIAELLEVASDVQGVVDEAEAARDAAQAAQAAAELAQGKAETAQGKAEDAQTAAETAQGKAETAQTNAESAASNAQTYSQQASSFRGQAIIAKNEAVTAQGKAETAQGKAEAAQTAAETAQGKAEAAQTAAETAQGKAEDAQEAAESALASTLSAKDDAISAITAQQATSVAAVQAKGTEVIASIPQDYTALSTEVGDLKSAVTQINLNTEPYAVDFENIVAHGDSSTYYSYDGYTVTVLKADGRNEANLYKFWLEAGVRYAVVTDGISVVTAKFQIYAPATQTMAFNSSQSTTGGAELVFTPNVSGYYTLKITNVNAFPQYITNLKLVNYDLWRRNNDVAVLPEFLTGFSDAQNINHTLKHASLHNFSRVYVPYKANGYTIGETLKIYSNTELVADNNTLFTLANNVNSEMISNANISLTSTHTDTNITINGGIWDGNRSNQSKWILDGSTKKKLVVGFLFVGVDYLTIKNAIIRNTRTYGCLIGNSNDIDVHHIIMDVGDMNNPDNGDGVHFLGPVVRVNVHDCNLHSEDNAIAVNADDVDHGDLITTTGDITDVEISNIYINNYDGGQGMLLLSADHKLENAKIHNISGIGHYVLHLSNFGLGSGNYRDITVSDIDFNLLTPYAHGFTITGNSFNLSFDTIKISSIDWTTAGQCTLFHVGNQEGTFATNIRTLVIDGVYVNGYSNGKLLKLIDVHDNAVVGNLALAHLYSNDNVSGCYLYPLIIQKALIPNLQMIDCNFNNLRSGIILIDDASASLQACYIDGIVHDNYSAVKIYNPYEVTINDFTTGNRFNSMGFEIPKCINSETVRVTHVKDGLPNQVTYFNKGDIIVVPTSESIGYKCTESGTRYTAYRAADTAYTRGTFRKYGDYLLVCVVSGTSGSDDFTVTENVEVQDGTCYWRALFKGDAEFVAI